MLKKTLDTFGIHERINPIIENIIDSFQTNYSVDHISKYPIPSKDKIIEIINDLIDILFPGYFSGKEINEINLKYYLGDKINKVFEDLSEEIAKGYRHEHCLKDKTCDLGDECINQCIDTGIEVTLSLLAEIPEIRRKLAHDVKAAFDGDPAAQGFNEIVFSYPGLSAITVHRIAHILYERKIPLIPRIMSEYSHSLTGIDIHPGAEIGESFFIDHGTGVVIGETCNIGNHVKIYQGVTLGALSFPKDEKGNIIKGKKRHPTIEDNVTIYSGATILGGDTVIGKNSVVGGNVWLVSSISPGSRVLLSESQATPTIKISTK